MNCERVFELLTRPALADKDGRAIADHSIECGECRELSRGLRPAADLLRTETANTLAVTGMVAAGDQAADETRAVDTSAKVSPRRTQWLVGIAAALLLGVMLGVMAGRLVGTKSDAGAASPPPRVHANGVHFAQQLRDSLDLSQACTIIDTKSRLSRTLICCTTCHVAGNKNDTLQVPVPRLVQGCQFCHAR